MVEIYRASRELPACKRRKLQKAREEELMNRIEAQVIAARMAEQAKQAKNQKQRRCSHEPKPTVVVPSDPKSEKK